MYVLEAVLLLSCTTDFGFVKALAMFFVLAASILFISLIYSLVLILRMKNGRGFTIGSLIILYSIAPLLSGVKGKLYTVIADAANGMSSLAICVIAFAAVLAAAEFTKKKAAELIE